MSITLPGDGVDDLFERKHVEHLPHPRGRPIPDAANRLPVRVVLVHRGQDLPEDLLRALEETFTALEVFHEGEACLDRVSRSPPDLVLAGLKLDDMDGLDLCRRIRGNPSTLSLPLVFLGDGGDTTDRIVAFELGADDFVEQPCSPREIVLRVRAIIRRRKTARTPAYEGAAVRCGGLALFPAEHRLVVKDEERILTPTECRLLHTLVRRAGRTQKREALVRDVWPDEGEKRLRTLDVYVHRLRQKLGSEAFRLETVVGVGYRLRA